MYPNPYQWVPGLKGQRSETYHLPLTTPKVTSEWNYTCMLPINLHGVLRPKWNLYLLSTSHWKEWYKLNSLFQTKTVYASPISRDLLPISSWIPLCWLYDTGSRAATSPEVPHSAIFPNSCYSYISSKKLYSGNLTSLSV